MNKEYKNWIEIEKLPLNNTISIRKLLPKENVFGSDILTSRTERFDIPRKQWNQIKDIELPDDYAKDTYSKGYFTTCIYTLRRVHVLSVAAQQSIEKSITITHTSTMRNTITETMRLDIAINAGSYSEKGSLMGNLSMTYELANMKEYATEDTKTTFEMVMYQPIEYDRDVAFWDVAKIIILYRVNDDNTIKMIALDDYYMETYQKTYIDLPDLGGK